MKAKIQEIFKDLSPEATVEKWEECIKNGEYAENIPFLYDEIDDIYGVISKNFPREDLESFHALDDFRYFLSKQNSIPADYRKGLTFGFCIGFEAAYALAKWWAAHPADQKAMEDIRKLVKEAFKDVDFKKEEDVSKDL